MLDVAVRLVDAWLQHAEHGLVELATTLPRTNLGGRPDDEAPPIPTFYNDADQLALMDEKGPDVVPAWVTWGDSQWNVPLRGHKIARECILGSAFITDDQQDETLMNRACGYLMRGGMLSLSRFNSQTLSKEFRTLNGVTIHEISSVTEQRISAAVGRRRLWGLLEIHAIVVETYS
jgi:hypothetical protein